VIPVIVLAVLLVAVVAAGAALTQAARQTLTVTLTGPHATAGELLRMEPAEGCDIPPGVVVVRRVMNDLTASHVVLVRPYRRWHALKATRRWL
jgi:hypothetical protein